MFSRQMRLSDFLTDYDFEGIYPFHMPGHKRNAEMAARFGLYSGNPFSVDATEVAGLDDLINGNDPDGILARSRKMAAEVFGAGQTFYSVCGSTTGILAAVHALAAPGSKVLTERESHRSVYNAIALRRLEPVYFTGPEQAAALLDAHPDAGLVILTRPHYDGSVYDPQDLIAAAHRLGIPVLVDEAHGAHFRFSPDFPEDALSLGADVVVQSLHKTLPALTPCALIHIRGSLADPGKISSALSIYHTSSPSYLLMASADGCIRMMAEHGAELMERYTGLLRGFYDSVSGLGALRCRPFSRLDGDMGKINIFTGRFGLTGPELAALLRERYKIETEMASPSRVLAMTSVFDTENGFRRLASALSALDAEFARSGGVRDEAPCEQSDENVSGYGDASLPVPGDAVLPPWRALEAPSRQLLLEDAAGLVSAEYLFAYPPGVPIIAPGEAVTSEAVKYILAQLRSGIEFHTGNGHFTGKISVVTS